MLSPEQLEQRKQGIGASEIAAVAGLSPWSSPIDVWLAKTGKSDGGSTGMAARGHDVEVMIAKWYAEHAGIDPDCLIESGTCVGDEPWIMATPDRIVVDLGEGGTHTGVRLMEAKNVGFRVLPHWQQGTEYEPPDYVVAQVTWQMLASGIEAADVAALLGGRDFEVFPVAWMPELAADLVEVGREFWTEYVLKDEPPPVDASDGWKAYLASKWPEDREPPKPASEEAETIARDLKATREAIAELETVRAGLENALKVEIADAAGLEGAHFRATFKRTKSGGVDWKALAMDFGATSEQIATYTREGSRRFLFTWKD